MAVEDRQKDALKFLPGWKGGIYEAVESTPPDCISRSKLADRSELLDVYSAKCYHTLTADWSALRQTIHATLHQLGPSLGT